jgi:hypothetical protein
LNIATTLRDAGVFMDRKDWLVALLAASLVVLGALGGSFVAKTCLNLTTHLNQWATEVLLSAAQV